MKYFFLTVTSLLMSSLQLLLAQNEIDTTNVEEIIIQESRMLMKFSKNSRNIQVLTKAEINQLPIKSLNELLMFVGGVDIRQRGPFGTQADISMDGGSFEQTLILLNGVKLVDSQTAHNVMNLPISIDMIERIEVLKGSAARVYGINALTGAINIVTRKSKKSFVTGNTYIGSSFKDKDSLEGKGKYFGGGIQVSANYGSEKQQHLFAMSKDQYNGQRYNSASETSKIFYNGNIDLNHSNQLSIMGGYIHNDFGANGFYAAPGDKNSREIVETFITSVGSKHQFKNLVLQPRISNRYNKDDYRYLKHDISKARSVHYSNSTLIELNGSYKSKIGDFGFGVESRFETINSSNIGSHHRENFGAFAEYKFELNKKIIGNIGTYLNYNSNYSWQAYPGVDLLYVINSNWKIGTNFGLSQRIPSFTDLYINQAINKGNPYLNPEFAYQGDFKVQYNHKSFNASVGYFFRDVTNFIDWVRYSISDPYVAMNVGNIQMHGLNTRISQNIKLNETNSIKYIVTYNMILSDKKGYTDQMISKYVLENLRHQVIVGLNYSYRNTMIQLNTRVIKRELNDTYSLIDFRVLQKLNKFEIYADVSNVLDTEYKEVGAVPMPTRWISFGVKVNVEKLK